MINVQNLEGEPSICLRTRRFARGGWGSVCARKVKLLESCRWAAEPRSRFWPTVERKPGIENVIYKPSVSHSLQVSKVLDLVFRSALATSARKL